MIFKMFCWYSMKLLQLYDAFIDIYSNLRSIMLIMWKQKTKIPQCQNSSKIPHCQNSSKIPHWQNSSKDVIQTYIFVYDISLNNFKLKYINVTALMLKIKNLKKLYSFTEYLEKVYQTLHNFVVIQYWHQLFIYLLSVPPNPDKWVSDCCLMPSEQLFSFIMAITSYFLVKWW